MQCILEEFNDLKEAENYINKHMKENKKSRLEIFPYAVEPNVPRYLVLRYKEKEQKEEKTTMGFCHE